MPVSDDAYIQKRIHQARKLHIIFEHSGWILEAIVVVVRAVIFSELIQELPKGHVDTTSTLSEVSKAIVSLSFSIDDLIAGLLNKICLVLPKVIRFLEATVALEQAWPICLHIVVEEALRCHCTVVALRHFLVDRVNFFFRTRLIGQELVEILVAKLSLHPLVERCVIASKLFVAAH